MRGEVPPQEILAPELQTRLVSAASKAAELYPHHVEGKGMRVFASEALADEKVRLCAGHRGAVVTAVMLVHAQAPTLHLLLQLDMQVWYSRFCTCVQTRVLLS